MYYLVVFDREPIALPKMSETSRTFKVEGKPNYKWYKRKPEGKRYYTNNLSATAKLYDSLEDVEADKAERKLIMELHQYMVTTPSCELSLSDIKSILKNNGY